MLLQCSTNVKLHVHNVIQCYVICIAVYNPAQGNACKAMQCMQCYPSCIVLCTIHYNVMYCTMYNTLQCNELQYI